MLSFPVCLTASEFKQDRLEKKLKTNKQQYRLSEPPSGRTLATLYEEIGGMHACRRLSERFHDLVADDLVLRAMFPKNLSVLTEHFALFLAETLGGPADYSAKRGKPRLLCRHAPFPIGPPEVERWLHHMFAALEDLGVADTLQQPLRDYFTQTAPTLSDPFISFYQMPLEPLRAALDKTRSLATAIYEGRTLLRDAAGRWDLPRVRLLLEYGALGSMPDALYRAANAHVHGRDDEGCAVVELLLQHGAEVNGRCGVGSMTPLHMAARRGTVAIAKVLITAGADIEARDTKGETPLRRAVNCGQEGVACLLLAHGADPLSQDRQGRTVQEIALKGRPNIGKIFSK